MWRMQEILSYASDADQLALVFRQQELRESGFQAAVVVEACAVGTIAAGGIRQGAD